MEMKNVKRLILSLVNFSRSGCVYIRVNKAIFTIDFTEEGATAKGRV